MSDSQNQNAASLLWDCFTNWSQTLENTVEPKASPKKEKNKDSNTPAQKLI